ncbi:MAG: hypothetical protein WCF18_13310 [Chthoniobacteraceae bacterium]
MKLPILLAFLTLSSIAALDAEPPAVPIEQALKLAMTHLADRGLAGQHYIGSLTLEDSTLTGGKRFWYARWEPSIRTENTKESGLRIDMDGSLSRLTSGGPGGGSGGGRADLPGQRRVGARSIR